MQKFIIKASSIFLILGAWFLIADCMQLVTPVLFPPIAQVLTKFFAITFGTELLADLGATCMRWLAGFGLGILLGTPLGLVIGSRPRLYSFLEFPLEFLRSLPATAIFPLFLMVFGIGDQAKIALAFLPTFLIQTVNSCYGVRLAPKERRQMARSFGASAFQIFRSVTFFDALPQIFVGLRLTLSQSLVVTIVSEMFIGTETGLGQRLFDCYLTNSAPSLYAIIILLGLIGYLSNLLLIRLEKRFVHWGGR